MKSAIRPVFSLKNKKDSTDLGDSVSQAALNYVLKNLTLAQRQDYEGHSRTSDANLPDHKKIDVSLKCSHCRNLMKASVIVRDGKFDDVRSGHAVELGRQIVDKVKLHNDSCIARANQQKMQREREKQATTIIMGEASNKKTVLEHPASQTKKQNNKLCRICKKTDSMYPSWEGPCSHQIDKGVRYKPFEKLAQQYDL